MPLRESFQRFLGSCAARTLAREKPFIIAVTGTVGKSSAKQAIAAALKADEPASLTRVSRKNYNNELGLPLTIFERDAPGRSVVGWMSLLWKAWATSVGLRSTGIRTFVFEMGADKPGDLAYLTSIAVPDISVVTAVTPEDPSWAPVHAANYPSIDTLAEEKATLVRATKPEGMAILNADDVRVAAMRQGAPCHVATFGRDETANVRLMETRTVMETSPHGAVPVGLEVVLEYFHRRKTLLIPGVFGSAYGYAICAGAAVAVTMDIGQEAIDEMPSHLAPLPGRTRIIPGIKGTTLLDDSYNASPVAVLSAIRDLAALPLTEYQVHVLRQDPDVICIGEMRELGEQSSMLHRRVGQEAAERGIDLLVACGIFGRAIADGARAAGMPEERIRVFEDTPEAGLFLQDWIRPGDVVLAKASEGPLPSDPNFGKVTGVRADRIIKELMAEPDKAEQLLCRQTEAWKRK